METTRTRLETEEARNSLRRSVAAETDSSITGLQASLLLDFVLKDIGPFACSQEEKHPDEYLGARLEDLPATGHEAPLPHWTRRNN
ncbi:MAG TPA: DUF2164 family protein [Candidatus Didemnitutus sp.]|jgi:uncharacterized protein (DUF2164 family)